MKRITNIRFAVTGASGFLGSNMVSLLKDKGHWVRAIIRKPNSATKHAYKRADEVAIVDITSPPQALKSLKNIDYVFHFAADMGGVGYFSEEQYYPFVTNMSMDLNILTASEKNGVKRLFYPSSACAYPTDAHARLKKTPKLHERMLVPSNPDQMYGWEKLLMILLAKHAPVEVRVGILHTIFGIGQEWEGKRAKFPAAITYKVIQSKKTGTPVKIWGNGKQIRTFLYITDALNKIYEVMMSSHYHGEVNISNSEQVTIKQCALWLCEFAGIKPTFIFQKDKPTGVLYRGVDNKKFTTHYSYKNKISTKEGFKLLYEYIVRQTASATRP
jgi:GDP-D-mannose 3', 5'-epimerase